MTLRHRILNWLPLAAGIMLIVSGIAIAAIGIAYYAKGHRDAAAAVFMPGGIIAVSGLALVLFSPRFFP